MVLIIQHLKTTGRKHNYHDDSFGGANAGTVASTLWRVRK